MTDKEKLANLFNEFGIGYEIGNDLRRDNLDSIYLWVDFSEDGTKIKGYTGFCTYFYFDENEKFLHVGIYE